MPKYSEQVAVCRFISPLFHSTKVTNVNMRGGWKKEGALLRRLSISAGSFPNTAVQSEPREQAGSWIRGCHFPRVRSNTSTALARHSSSSHCRSSSVLWSGVVTIPSRSSRRGLSSIADDITRTLARPSVEYAKTSQISSWMASYREGNSVTKKDAAFVRC